MKIGIYVDVKEGLIPESMLGPLSLAAQGEAVALVLDGVTSEAYGLLARNGVKTVVEMALPGDAHIRSNPVIRARALVRAVEELGLEALVGLSNAPGRDVLPRAAALLDAPLVMDCTAVDPGAKTVKTSQYSGKVLAEMKISGSPMVLGIRPNALVAGTPPCETASPNLITLEVDASEPRSFRVIKPAAAPSQGDALPALAEAEVIIAGGRGMKNRENFGLLFECAKKMKAAVGASRVAVDNDWIPYAHQVGQTGEKVSPSVYIACGISGSIQHFAGMKTARMIIAVNTDREAAMMANCDYAVEGDLVDILTEFNRML